MSTGDSFGSDPHSRKPDCPVSSAARRSRTIRVRNRSRAAVNRYFDAKGQDASRRLFAIMLGDTVVGELQLKQIDHDKKECTLSIHMQNDAVKGKGYGTQAERLAVKIAFDELGMAAVNADTVMKNTRSQHVLEKAGFRFVGEDGTFKYYRIER